MGTAFLLSASLVCGSDTFANFNGFYGGYNFYFEHNEEVNWEPIEEQSYGTILERDQTLQLLEALQSEEDPFFLYLAWQAAHLPVEAPTEYIERYDNSSGSTRQTTQAQISVLDDCVRDVVEYLQDNEMWDDTLIVFTSDNGPEYEHGDSFPLRGFKNSSFEGGIRTPAFVTGGFLAEDRRANATDDGDEEDIADENNADEGDGTDDDGEDVVGDDDDTDGTNDDAADVGDDDDDDVADGDEVDAVDGDEDEVPDDDEGDVVDGGDDDVIDGDEEEVIDHGDAMIFGAGNLSPKIDLKSKSIAISVVWTILIVLLFFGWILRNDVAIPEMVPNGGKLINYASC